MRGGRTEYRGLDRGLDWGLDRGLDRGRTEDGVRHEAGLDDGQEGAGVLVPQVGTRPLAPVQSHLGLERDWIR